MYNPGGVFKFMADAQARGQAVALVTITGVTGGSSRNPGAHLAVSEDGRFAGSLSGGCIEAAVVAEALSAIAEGRPRAVRFGQGSPYIDIRLPCGGSLDLLFNPVRDSMLGGRLVEALALRQPARLSLPRTDGDVTAGQGEPSFAIDGSEASVEVNHIPPLRLALFGQGAALDTLAALARPVDALVSVFTPDENRAAPDAVRLKTPGLPAEFACDPWTAAALLFHDHDWEAPILERLLDGPAFFIGAMGSNKTHALRCEVLRERSVSEDTIARIVAPIGLIPSMRDPETLAVSILAQVVAAYNSRFLQQPGD